MNKYVLVCIELERVKRLLERTTITKKDFESKDGVSEECTRLRAIEQTHIREIGQLKEEVSKSVGRVKELEQVVRDKDRIITSKE